MDSDVVQVAEHYDQWIEHLENVVNLVVHRFPGDEGICYVVRDDMEFTTMRQARKASFNHYDIQTHGGYPIVHRYVRRDGTLSKEVIRGVPYLKVVCPSRRTRFYIRLKRLEDWDYTHITSENFFKYVDAKPPGLEKLPSGGEVVRVLEQKRSN